MRLYIRNSLLILLFLFFCITGYIAGKIMFGLLFGLLFLIPFLIEYLYKAIDIFILRKRVLNAKQIIADFEELNNYQQIKEFWLAGSELFLDISHSESDFRHLHR